MILKETFTYVWQWQMHDVWSDLGLSAQINHTVEEAMERHPQKRGPHQWCDSSVPVRLIERTTTDRLVP